MVGADPEGVQQCSDTSSWLYHMQAIGMRTGQSLLPPCSGAQGISTAAITSLLLSPAAELNAEGDRGREGKGKTKAEFTPWTLEPCESSQNLP